MDVNFAGSTIAVTAYIAPTGKPVEQSKILNNDSTFDPANVDEAEQSIGADKALQGKEGEAGNAEDLNTLTAELTDMMSLMRKGLAFTVDDRSGRNVVSVMDVDSGELIRQIPNEEALELAKKFAEVAGFLLKTEA
ncbi:flagellar protein FlaG [Shewanella gelidimarina]|uniref:flagellar protein FlaG n=1 Tax=Shewanella gelidimarina TaxID=56813 RepID=UPI00200DB793|nr:flagellar protein FlaG [Shewanella gelidimarina]MCL1057828.1 flagellar protein FlaG [Shewanella gelidimarina]